MKSTMKITGLALAAALMAGPALAADLVVKAKPAPSPAPNWWEIAYGGALMSDYNFRGISQSDRGVSGTAYVEGRANLSSMFQIYGGFQAWATKLPTDPIGEFDVYGGLRATFGPVVFDFGAIYYWYPNETQLFFADAGLTTVSPTNFGFGAFTLRNTDFWEVYGKVTWTANDWLTLGGYVYYSPDWLQTGADGTYAGATVKLTAPSAWFPSDWGAYISGEVAHYWFGTPDPFFTLPFVDYTYWNAGLALTYKVFTLDLRYHDTDLNRSECFALTGDPSGVATGRSKWCGQTFIAKLSFDATLK
jgi:uncharacterized protein (TIGR02001 family)